MVRCKRCDGKRFIKAINPYGGQPYEFYCPACNYPPYNEIVVTNWEGFREDVRLGRVKFPPSDFKIIVPREAMNNTANG